VDLLPVKTPGRKAQLRWFYFYIISDKDQVILTKRGDRDIWKSLYHFPVLESLSPLAEEEVLGNLMSVCSGLSSGLQSTSLSPSMLHQLSHRTIHARFIHAKVSSLPASLPEGWLRIPRQELDSYPVPRLISRYLESFKF
jgi:A/G-specific adenine glycosylase